MLQVLDRTRAGNVTGRIRGATIFAVVFTVRAYQALLRPFLIGSCKFYPTCSEYAVEALQTHGVVRGAWLAFGRVLRCHPFAPGGLDPVPSRDRSRDGSAHTPRCDLR